MGSIVLPDENPNKEDESYEESKQREVDGN